MILLPVFFLIAVIYSSVGLGGGSAYITALVLAGTPRESLPLVALGCNIVVALQGFIQFRHAGHFRWKLFWPFALTSIPMAYVGGLLPVSDASFQALLVAALSIAAIRLMFFKSSFALAHRLRLGDWESVLSWRLWSLFLVGAALGAVAGITGIGGGIYLIPTLLFLGIATPKEAAAIAGLFIVVNSAAGLAGHLSRAPMDWRLFLPLAAAVFVGGLLGSRIGARRLSSETLQRIVGAVMLVAVAKLLWNLLG